MSSPKQGHPKEPSEGAPLPEQHQPRPADARSPDSRLGRRPRALTLAWLPVLLPIRFLVTAFLLQRLQENSDLKTHQPFAAVMTTLCECKDQASKTFSR